MDLYVLMDDGTIATTEIKNAVLAACNDDTVRPLTDKVSVKDPQKVSYNITFTYYVPKDSALSSTEIKAAVDEAVTEFVSWQCGKLGRDINPSVLIGKLMQTGIKRVALTSRSLPRCETAPTTRRRRSRRSAPSPPRTGATRMNNAHGITKENLLASLPAVLANDDNMAALAAAVAEVLANRVDEIGRVDIYSQIDQLPNELLDILAYDFKVDWWDANYTLEEKRRTLKDSWNVHRRLGTKAAVVLAISAIYPDTQVSEWWEYGGKPYHFKLLIDATYEDVDPDRHQRVIDRVAFL